MAQIKGYQSDLSGEFMQPEERIEVHIILRGDGIAREVKFDGREEEVEQLMQKTLPEDFVFSARKPRGRAAVNARKGATKKV